MATWPTHRARALRRKAAQKRRLKRAAQQRARTTPTHDRT